MINTIIESISVALNAEFGDKYKIHREEKRQGLKEPCFFVQCLNPMEELFLWKRYFRQNQFCIQYFPEDKLHGKQECYAVGERLFSLSPLPYATVTVMYSLPIAFTTVTRSVTTTDFFVSP